MGKKRGPALSIVHSFSDERLKRTYEIYRSLRKIAEVVEANREVVRRLYKERGIFEKWPHLKGGGEVVVPPTKEKRSYGEFALWLKENPDVKLPRHVEKIAKIVGCSATSIRSYFCRERKALAERLQLIPDLRQVSVELRTNEGLLINSGDVLRYSYVIDKFTLAVTIKIVLRQGIAIELGRVTGQDIREVFVPLASVSAFEQRMMEMRS